MQVPNKKDDGASEVGEQSDEMQDELKIFALLTLDCLALSRAMLDADASSTEEDQLERLRRERLVRRIEAVLGDGWIPRTGHTGTG